jgi:3-oxoacyl-[acyl-carrier-protein] synthase-1
VTSGPPSVISASAICAVGGGVAQIEASIRAGLSGVAAISICDHSFSPIRMGLVPRDALDELNPSLDALPLTSRQRRMLRLASPVLHEVTADLAGLGAIPIFLGLPDAHPRRPPPAQPAFLEHLQIQAGIVFDPTQSRVLPAGRAAGLLALEAGLRCLQDERSEVVIVGAIDTFVDLALLGELDADRRLLGTGAMDGFIPGEGAAFVALRRSRAGPRSDVRRAAVIATGSVIDPGHRYGDAPATGEGLSRAIEGMRASMPASSPLVRTTFAGFNGESFGAKEWGVARLRHRSFFDPNGEVVHPADCYGDAGAATGVLLIAMTQHALARGHRSGPILVWASSDTGAVACAYLALAD